MDGSLKEVANKKRLFWNTRISLRRKPKFIETDDGNEIGSKICTELFHKSNFRSYDRYISKGAVFAEKSNG